MKVNLPTFFDSVRASLFNGKLTTAHVQNMEAIIKYACLRIDSYTQLAYILATCYHETAGTMRPIKEYGLGKGYDYGQMLDMGKGPGQRVAYTTPKQLYYGRGYVQLTWRSNYASMGKLCGVDLVNHPDKALEPDIATKILVEGMIRGSFTGKKLADYFNATTIDPLHARRIINGMDKATLIQSYYSRFYEALTKHI